MIMAVCFHAWLWRQIEFMNQWVSYSLRLTEKWRENLKEPNEDGGVAGNQRNQAKIKWRLPQLWALSTSFRLFYDDIYGRDTTDVAPASNRYLPWLMRWPKRWGPSESNRCCQVGSFEYRAPRLIRQSSILNIITYWGFGGRLATRDNIYSSHFSVIWIPRHNVFGPISLISSFY